ncbi:MAG TPA: tetratricopeptide repeat protein [Bryobacteraceae bacterium]|jgi:tetratricopeptide (TPR) repeat protein
MWMANAYPRLVSIVAAIASLPALAQDPYGLLKSKDYLNAIPAFEAALEANPRNVNLRKDYAYTLLKIGESESARDQFAEIEKSTAADWQAALEYGFLCNETRKIAIAREVFDRVRKQAPEPFRSSAEKAFQNIDKPLAEGIARWRRAVELSPNNFSSHEELAHLAEQRGELALAEQHYMYAWRLRNDRRAFLLDIGRVRTAMGKPDLAFAPLLAASRGAEPRVADTARALLPARYPYVSEFESALTLDPANLKLRRELAFLFLAMKQPDRAEEQLSTINAADPKDRLTAAQLGFLYLVKQDPKALPLLNSVLDGPDDELSDKVRTTLRVPQTLHRRAETPTAKVNEEARVLASKSLEKGYLKDALRYLRIVYETDPIDFETMMKLGWTNNILKQDAEAVKWFRMARQSPDEKISTEAGEAYRNLAPSVARFRTTVWLYPLYSSRWMDEFGYAQAKTEIKIDRFPLRPYVSARFIGDLRQTTDISGLPPQYLSENSFIFAIGLATPVYHHAMGWFEAGEALSYLGHTSQTGLMIPDYRGGLSYNRGWGQALGSKESGWFADSSNDGLFVSRFNKDMLLYSQNRTGYTFVPEAVNFQTFWSWNATFDSRGYSWANFFEIGPGIRFRFDAMPKSMFFTVQALRGTYLVHDPAHRPQYNDFRAGVWYAFTR